MQTITNLRQTPTGPVAQIDGVWYSVNASHETVHEIRFALSEREIAALELNRPEPSKSAYDLAVRADKAARAARRAAEALIAHDEAAPGLTGHAILTHAAERAELVEIAEFAALRAKAAFDALA